MDPRDTVTFYLHPKLRRRAERGNHNFIAKLGEVLIASGMYLDYDDDDDAARARAATRPGRSLFLMQEPVNARGLTMRKTYLYPFWHIEKKAARWDWPVAQARFSPSLVDPQKAQNFYRFWRLRLFDEAPMDARRDGFVYVPLQSQLLKRRSFQTCTPVEMVKAVLAHEKSRKIILTLHPNETYSPPERQALDALVKSDDRITLETGPMERFLECCDYVVTQNSSVGFMAYFFGKPVILFAKADFHHIALNVEQIGVQNAFHAAPDHDPDYADYLQWFLQEQAINAGRPEVKTRIRTVLRDHGWPV
jgi:hypothetical protein